MIPLENLLLSVNRIYIIVNMNMKWATDSPMTLGFLIGLLLLMAFLPRLMGLPEGFTTMRPNMYRNPESIGPYDGKKPTACEGPVRMLPHSGQVLVPQPGGSAFAPPADPQVDDDNNQLWYMLRNQTQQTEAAALSSGLSTSTGPVVLSQQQAMDLLTRGGNRTAPLDL
jgi:hypothetical protein